MSSIMRTQPSLVAAVAAIFVVLVISLLSKWSDSSTGSFSQAFKQTMRNNMNQAAMYSNVAKQDKHPVIALANCSHANAYLKCMRRLATDRDIGTLTNVDPKEFDQVLTEQQQQILQEIGSICPALQLSNRFVVNTGVD